jgi:hypothetical protein
MVCLIVTAQLGASSHAILNLGVKLCRGKTLQLGFGTLGAEYTLPTRTTVVVWSVPRPGNTSYGREVWVSTSLVWGTSRLPARACHLSGETLAIPSVIPTALVAGVICLPYCLPRTNVPWRLSACASYPSLTTRLPGRLHAWTGVESRIKRSHRQRDVSADMRVVNPRQFF